MDPLVDDVICERAGIIPTCIGYNALLEVHALQGDLESATALVENMRLEQVHPTPLTVRENMP